MKKIQKIKRLITFIFWLFLLGSLILTKATNLDWGLPSPMHPDERNMAVALQNLQCPNFELLSNLNFNHFLNWLKNCYNPHFYAYGQLPLYLGYFFIALFNSLINSSSQIINFYQAVISLRMISFFSSIFNFFILYKLLKLFYRKITKRFYFLLLTFIYVPFFIQFGHFGTTESLLMFFYSTIVYVCLKNLRNKSFDNKNIFYLGLLSGLAFGTKISSFIFVVPVVLVIYYQKKTLIEKLSLFLNFFIITLFFFLISSPHNFINYKEFLSSMDYETAVATGRIKVFYTYQFENSIPIIFQIFKIFPYSFGWPLFILFLLGFIFTSWRDKKFFVIKLSIISYFLTNGILYAKWSRFLTPIFPLMLILAAFYLTKIKSRFLYLLIILISIIPGVAFLSIYQNEDIRIIASKWMYNNLKNNSFILSETANVVDIPYVIEQIDKKNFKYVSFNFYDLDNNYELQMKLKEYLKTADYILIPSRRIAYNYTCFFNPNDIAYYKKRCQEILKKFPILQNYYYNLLYSGNYKLIKTFSNFPKIEFFGKTLIEFPDEKAEETWTIFDHPVIRIYKKL